MKSVFLRSRLLTVKQHIQVQSTKKEKKTVGQRLLEQAEKEKREAVTRMRTRSAVRKLLVDEDMNKPKQPKHDDFNKAGQPRAQKTVV
ncbi:unnamed protein product [Cylicostephanus goldi]|uniref:Uncharacterized protein n=1 Tax=Cylicostephanus goldi TaxID=71465 RepID=A0A3P6RUR2_CYLGO|nr:unnamed protein product [Cylicostephanus goldi]